MPQFRKTSLAPMPPTSRLRRLSVRSKRPTNIKTTTRRSSEPTVWTLDMPFYRRIRFLEQDNLSCRAIRSKRAPIRTICNGRRTSNPDGVRRC
jgi:hypothetical protein